MYLKLLTRIQSKSIANSSPACFRTIRSKKTYVVKLAALRKNSLQRQTKPCFKKSLKSASYPRMLPFDQSLP